MPKFRAILSLEALNNAAAKVPMRMETLRYDSHAATTMSIKTKGHDCITRLTAFIGKPDFGFHFYGRGNLFGYPYFNGNTGDGLIIWVRAVIRYIWDVIDASCAVSSALWVLREGGKSRGGEREREDICYGRCRTTNE